eukprot:376185-Alexandrium_andersonii.AAC.1
MCIRDRSKYTLTERSGRKIARERSPRTFSSAPGGGSVLRYQIFAEFQISDCKGCKIEQKRGRESHVDEEVARAGDPGNHRHFKAEVLRPGLGIWNQRNRKP